MRINIQVRSVTCFGFIPPSVCEIQVQARQENTPLNKTTKPNMVKYNALVAPPPPLLLPAVPPLDDEDEEELELLDDELDEDELEDDDELPDELEDEELELDELPPPNCTTALLLVTELAEFDTTTV
jgi:hypothetical protein